MALPVNIATSKTVLSGYNPLHKIGSNYYYMIPDTGGLHCYKATAIDGTYSAIDDSTPPGNSNTLTALATVNDGTSIHCFYEDGTDELFYSRFASDVWAQKDLSVTGGVLTRPPVTHSLGICIRNDSGGDNVVLIANGNGDNVHGNTADVVMFWTKTNTGTTISTGPVDIDSSASVQERYAACGISTDGTNVHVIYGFQSGSTQVAVASSCYARTIKTDDTLGTRQGSDAKDAGTGSHTTGHPISSTIYWEAVADAGGTLGYITTGEDANDELNSLSSATSSGITDCRARPTSPYSLCHSAAVDAASGDIYVLYSGGGTTGVDHDVYYTTSANGTTWDTAVEVDDAVDCSAVYAAQVESNKIAYVYVTSTGTYTVNEIDLGGVDACLADNIQSLSNVSTPDVGQKHALLADNVQSLSNVSTPSLGQTHVLLADNIESASNVSTPDLSEVNGLLADDIESASNVSTPTLGVIRNLLADNIESASNVSTPAVGQVHALLADDIQSLSNVSTPTANEVNNLLADNIESASNVSTPSIGQVHALLANDIESASNVTQPGITEVNNLLANNVESASNVSSPALGQTHALLADDIESLSNVSTPALVQVVACLADNIESASNVSTPAVGQVHVLSSGYIESASNVSTPSIGQVHNLLAGDVESASNVSTPTLTESNILLADDIESASNVSTPSIGQVHNILANNVESLSNVSTPSLGQVHALLADDIESLSNVSTPTAAQAHALLADNIESLSNVSTPSLTSGGTVALFAQSIEALTTVTTPGFSSTSDPVMPPDTLPWPDQIWSTETLFAFIGTHYTATEWSTTVRHPGGAGFLDNPSAQDLLDLQTTMETYDVILNVQGLGSGRDPVEVAAFMDGIEADDGAAWTTEVYNRTYDVHLLDNARARGVWQLGNEINSLVYSQNVMGWAGETGFQANDERVIPYFIEYYVAPALVGIRQASYEIYGDADAIQVMMGSIAGFKAIAAGHYLDELMNYEIVGTYAASLAGVRVGDFLTHISYHYLMTGDGSDPYLRFKTTYDVYGARYKIWATEEVGINRATGDLGGCTALQLVNRYADLWLDYNLDPDRHRFIMYGVTAGTAGTTVDDAMDWLLSTFTNGVPRPINTSLVSSSGTNLQLNTFVCGDMIMVIANGATLGSSATLSTLDFYLRGVPAITSELFTTTGHSADPLSFTGQSLDTPYNIAANDVVVVIITRDPS